ncbi:MAG: metallophosphoesterase [Eubacteriales bacterium]|nr:metallophosphoesterase [Eubacteriales bacterium]
MSIFAIGDLHLCSTGEKPMSVFGDQWDNHFEKIRAHWLEQIGKDDVVLIPGDISWAMQMEQAWPDLDSIAQLPGTKVLIRGNHDFWWSSIGKLRQLLPASTIALQNDSILLEGTAICGTRGWTFPSPAMPLEPQELKIYQRELLRLEMTLSDARRKAPNEPLIAMMHFPPLLNECQDTEYTRLMEKYRVDQVVYGHLHGMGIRNGFQGTHNGVLYRLTSCDAIGFKPVQII